MILNDVLDKAGFIDGKTYRKTRFVTAPKGTYAIWDVNETYRGTDDFAYVIKQNNFTIELYESIPDEEAEKRIEKQLIINGLAFTKSEREFVQSEQLYQTIYEFTHLEKMKGE